MAVLVGMCAIRPIEEFKFPFSAMGDADANAVPDAGRAIVGRNVNRDCRVARALSGSVLLCCAVKAPPDPVPLLKFVVTSAAKERIRRLGALFHCPTDRIIAQFQLSVHVSSHTTD